ncbi:MAG TPA: FtsW/RodA/SpoVE family cell cycle protein, partial [Candidatus Acidoferrum sp.]|nr:FtsW/RodA/SpoVE family cell cycle protein [Candidatus Acidoferrum sp.]
MNAVVLRLRACAPMVLALFIAGAALRLAPAGALAPSWLPYVLGAVALLWPMLRPANVTRDDTLPALAILISSIGLSVVARLSPQLAQRQTIWLAFSLALAVTAGPAFNRFRVLAAYKYIWILCAVASFIALALFGQEVNGARLWIRLGPVQFEPVEIIKLLVVLFM